MTPMRLRTALPAVLVLLAAAGCGGGGDDAGSDGGSTIQDAAEAAPACDEVWVDGGTLPENYEGCTNGDELVAPALYDCTDGSSFTAYDDRFFAVLGGQITEANTSTEEYSAAFADCTG